MFLSSSSSGSEGDFSSSECNFNTPRKKRYKKAIKHGLSKRRAAYHLASGKIETTTSTYEVDCSSSDTHQEYYQFSSSNSLSDVCSNSFDTSSTCSTEQSSESDTSSFISNDSSALPSDSEQDTFKNSLNDNCTIYEGSRQTFLSSYTAIMLFVIKHSLSKEAFADLLLLIESHLPENTMFCKSVYKMKTFLKHHIGMKPGTTHNFCENCSQIVTGEMCTSEPCQTASAKLLEFHDLQLEHQISELFQDHHFCNMIRKSNQRAGSEVLTDIQDGLQYKKLRGDFPTSLDKPFHLTMTMNTDGVSLYSSSKKGNLWPIYFAINEIPIKMRFSKKYILPSYLYCQTEKPNMLTYMKPMMETLKRLSEGMFVITPYGRQLVEAHLLIVTADLPARAMVANMKQFNGKHGCLYCLDEGETRPNCHMHRFWPLTEDNVTRSHKSFVDDARAAVSSNQAVNGIKGACPLMVLQYVDIPKVFAVDWMHCVLLGVTKSLLKMWLSNEHRGKTFYIGDKTALLNQRLQRIEIPDFMPRRQRGIEDSAHWKATECREWLLHFSVPVLEGIQNGFVLVHYMLLTTAMFLLNKDTIVATDIDYSEMLLLDFCRLYPDIYGRYQQTMNVHLLRHLPQFVRMYGPLFTTSCFGFESMNSFLKNMVHGTRHVNSQICLAVGLTKALPRLVKSLEETHADLTVLFDRLSSRLTRDKDSNVVDNHISMLGKKQVIHLNEEERNSAEAVISDEAISEKYLRMQRGNEIFYSQHYLRTKTRNSYTVLLQSGKIATVKFFIMINNVPMAMVDVLKEEQCSFDRILQNIENDVLNKYKHQALNHQFKQVKSENVIKVVPAEQIMKKCVLIKMGKFRTYVSVPPNLVEHS